MDFCAAEPTPRAKGVVYVRFDSLEQALEVGMNTAYWAERIPDVPALITPDGQVATFREFNGRANQFARAMFSAGIGSADSIALICPNRPEWAEVYFGSLRCGLRVTPINVRVQPEEAAYKSPTAMRVS